MQPWTSRLNSKTGAHFMLTTYKMQGVIMEGVEEFERLKISPKDIVYSEPSSYDESLASGRHAVRRQRDPSVPKNTRALGLGQRRQTARETRR
jgi:hypothetical protein